MFFLLLSRSGRDLSVAEASSSPCRCDLFVLGVVGPPMFGGLPVWGVSYAVYILAYGFLRSLTRRRR